MRHSKRSEESLRLFDKRAERFLAALAMTRLYTLGDLKQAGNLQSGYSGNGASQALHLAGEYFVHAAPGFIDGGADQVLQQFLIFSGKYFRVDANLGDLLLPVHLDGDHA